jgi:hypothetical protein
MLAALLVRALGRGWMLGALVWLALVFVASTAMAAEPAAARPAAWHAITAPGFSLHAVWGQNDRAVFAVGESGTVQRWDGLNWKPMVSGTDSSLFGIWGLPSGVLSRGAWPRQDPGRRHGRHPRG